VNQRGVTVSEAAWKRAMNDRDLLTRAIADYDRRRTHWWGRLLLWLLRKTT